MVMSGLLHAPTALPPGKFPQYPLDMRLGGTQRQSGGYGEEKIYLQVTEDISVLEALGKVFTNYAHKILQNQWSTVIIVVVIIIIIISRKAKNIFRVPNVLNP
jgi:hypothetical protein